MSVLEYLQAASFRGVPFYVKNATTSGGRRTSVKTFPKSDRRLVQDIGELKKTFAIDGFVSGTGADYLENCKALIDALTTAGQGLLVHPTFGQINVVPQPYTLTENITGELGIANFSMSFMVADSDIYPIAAGASKSAIVNSAQNCISAEQLVAAEEFKTPSIVSNIEDAANKVTDFADKIQAQVDRINEYSTALAEMQNGLTEFKNSVTALLQTPSTLMANITATFDSIISLASTPAQAMAMMSSLFSFGAADTAIDATTQSLVDRANNRAVLNNIVNSVALATAYSTVPTMTFNTSDDIETVRDTLEAQFNSISAGIDPDTRKILEETREQVMTYLTSAELAAWKIKTVPVPNMPVTALAYAYYANMDNADTLVSMNNTAEPCFMDGPIKILSK